MESEARLTRLASCAGCGAKVGAGTLAALLENFKTRTDPRLKGLKFYSPKGEELRIEIVYASAHIIRPLDYRAPHIADSLRAKAPCVLLSHGDIAAAMPEDAFTAVDTLRIGRYNNSNRSRFARHGNDSNFIYTVTLITPKHGSN